VACCSVLSRIMVRQDETRPCVPLYPDMDQLTILPFFSFFLMGLGRCPLGSLPFSSLTRKRSLKTVLLCCSSRSRSEYHTFLCLELKGLSIRLQALAHVNFFWTESSNKLALPFVFSPSTTPLKALQLSSLHLPLSLSLSCCRYLSLSSSMSRATVRRQSAALCSPDLNKST